MNPEAITDTVMKEWLPQGGKKRPYGVVITY